MKKTVIIAIFVVYLASILAVQLFGYPAVLPDSGVYIDGITITDVTLSNRTQGQDDKVLKGTRDGLPLYVFTFIKSTDPNGYTTDEESLANNPNRVKISYILEPEDASKSYLLYVVNNDNVVVLKETDELVFLKGGVNGSVKLTLKESKANLHAQDSVTIWAR